MMCALVVCVGVPVKANNNEPMLAGAVLAAVGAVAYMSCRESNASKITRAQNMVNTYRGQVEQALSLCAHSGIKDMNSRLTVKNTGTLRIDMVSMQNELLRMRNDLEARYWYPWNRTSQMQDTCAQVRHLMVQMKVAFLLLTAREAQGILDTYGVRVDYILDLLQYPSRFYETLKNIGSLKKELQEIMPVVRCLQKDLTTQACLTESPRGQSYEMTLTKAGRALDDFIPKVDLLLIVLKYTNCFVPNISEDALVKAARVICGKESSYPVMYVVDQLGNDIARINKMMTYVSCEQICLDMLDNVRTLLMQSEQQAIERQAYENYLQQQRLAAAAEAQARAAKAQADAAQAQAYAMQQQAWAQSRQAAALEESNEIERSKRW